MSTRSPRSIRIAQNLEPGVHRAVFVLLVGMSLFTVFFFVWAAIGKLDIAVHGRGELILSSRSQLVQSLEGGILRKLYVKPGSQVKKGEPLVQLDNQIYDSAYAESQQTYWGMQATLNRLDAEINQTEPKFSEEMRREAPDQVNAELRTWQNRKREINSTLAAAREQYVQRSADVENTKAKITSTQHNLSIAQDLLRKEQLLYSKGAGAEADLINAKAKVAQFEGELQSLNAILPGNRAAVEEAKQKEITTMAKFIADASTYRNDLKGKLEALRERMSGEKDRVARQEVIAPSDGIVNRILTNSIGGVVKAGETIMELVPGNDTIIVNTKVRPEDIGFIHVGQKTIVKISAYDSSIFGSIDGTVTRVGADALQDEKKEVYFEVQVSISEWPKDKSGKPMTVLPGMTADVAIRTGERTVLEYVMKPIAKVLTSSLKER